MLGELAPVIIFALFLVFFALAVITLALIAPRVLVVIFGDSERIPSKRPMA